MIYDLQIIKKMLIKQYFAYCKYFDIKCAIKPQYCKTYVLKYKFIKVIHYSRYLKVRIITPAFMIKNNCYLNILKITDSLNINL